MRSNSHDQPSRLTEGGDAASLAEALQAFFADKVQSLEGGPRELAPTAERIQLCATRRAAKADEVQTWFGTHQ